MLPHEKWYRLSKRNIVEHVRHAQEIAEVTLHWLNRSKHCPLVDAIRKHFYESKLGECVFFDKQFPVCSSSAGGISATVCHALVVGFWPESTAKTEHVRLKFDVGLYDEDAQQETCTTAYVDVPVDLMLHYSVAKFETWIKALDASRLIKQKKDDAETLARLAARYPELQGLAKQFASQ